MGSLIAFELIDSHYNFNMKFTIRFKHLTSWRFYKILLPLQHNALNDSHAQLMVHWLGEGSDVMICLARDPPLGPNDDPNATATAPSTSEFNVYSINFIVRLFPTGFLFGNFFLLPQFLFHTITATRSKIRQRSFNSTSRMSSLVQRWICS